MGRGPLRLAYERRGLRGPRWIAFDDGALGDRNLHKGRTGLEQFSVASGFGTVAGKLKRELGGFD